MAKTIECDGVKYNLIPVDADKASWLVDGQNYLVQTVTHYYLGRYSGEPEKGFIVLSDASWVADTGKFSKAISDGVLNEVEWLNKSFVYVSLGAVVSIIPWTKPLPSETK